MKALKSVLQTHVTGSGGLAEGKDILLGTSTDEKPFVQDALRDDLETLRNRINRNFYLVLGSLLFVFTAAISVVFIVGQDPTIVGALFGGTGVVVAGMITAITKIWKEKATIDVILALVGSIKEDALQSMLHVLLSKL